MESGAVAKNVFTLERGDRDALLVEVVFAAGRVILREVLLTQPHDHAMALQLALSIAHHGIRLCEHWAGHFATADRSSGYISFCDEDRCAEVVLATWKDGSRANADAAASQIRLSSKCGGAEVPEAIPSPWWTRST